MDIADKIPVETKAQLTNFTLEKQVLQNLLGERKEKANALVASVFKLLNLSPTLYGIEINPSKNVWKAVLRPGGLIVPDNGITEALRNKAPTN